MTVRDLTSERLASVLGLKERVKNGEADVVIAECRDIEALMAQPGWDFLIETLEEREKRELKQIMGRPASDSAADYAKFLGFLQGLRAIEPTAKAIAEFGKETDREQKNDEVAGEAA